MNEIERAPDDDADWTLPPQFSWGLAFLALILLPTSNGLFQFLTSPREAYAELRLVLGGETYVVAKNSGAGQVRIGDAQLLRQACLRVDADDAFSPSVLGVIPASCYSIAILRSPNSAKLPAKVFLDGEFGVEPRRLRLMTPVEEMQVVFATLVVLWMFISVFFRLQRWYRDTDVAMTGKR